MGFAIRLFLVLFFAAFKRSWPVTILPIVAVVIHGAYTGSWHIWTGIALSCALAATIAIVAMRRPM